MVPENGGEKLPKDVNDLQLPSEKVKEGIEKLTREKQEAERKAKLGLEFDIGELLDYDYEHDPNRLLGEKRWICKGSHCLWIGSTGVGKSSMCGHLGVMWSLGLDSFGIRPVSPLVCVAGQAEDDKGDLSEIIQGVTKGYALVERREEIRARFKIHRVRARGEKLRTWLQACCQEYAPDVIFINPLNKFSEGSLSKEEDAQRLVDIFDETADQYGVSFHVFHHTPKPQILKDGQKQIDMSYLGFGSSVIPDWARAIMVLSKTDTEGLFELSAAKRGGRAGLRDHRNQFTKSLLLRQGEHSILWQRDTSETPQAGNVGAFLRVLSKEKWTSDIEVKHALRGQVGSSPQEVAAAYSNIITTLHCESLDEQNGEYDKGDCLVKLIRKTLYFKLK